MARAGRYPASIMTDVAPMRLRQHFAPEGDHYRIRKAIRDRILFAEHNVLRDPPFSRLDLITCRNLLIYLNRDVQAKLLEIFHFALKPNGYLFLGGSESAELVADLFIPVDKKNRIYRARPISRASSYQSHLSSQSKRIASNNANKPHQRQFSYADMHQRALLEVSAPSIVLDGEGNIVHMSTSATRLFRMLGGEPSRNVLTLVVPELRLELRSALYQIQQGINAVTTRPVTLHMDADELTMTMIVTPYHDRDSAADFMLVQFSSSPAVAEVERSRISLAGNDAILNQLESELQRKNDQ